MAEKMGLPKQDEFDQVKTDQKLGDSERSAQACREAARQNKFSVMYVRAVLLDWIGISKKHR